MLELLFMHFLFFMTVIKSKLIMVTSSIRKTQHTDVHVHILERERVCACFESVFEPVAIHWCALDTKVSQKLPFSESDKYFV